MAISRAINDVVAERRSQISKGYTPDHDDIEHSDVHSLPLAAAAVCVQGEPGATPALVDSAPSWVKHIWRKHGRRQQMVIAAALLVAEIERLDRVAAETAAKGPPCDRCGGYDAVESIGHGFHECARCSLSRRL